jgi:hypothetical protein
MNPTTYTFNNLSWGVALQYSVCLARGRCWVQSPAPKLHVYIYKNVCICIHIYISLYVYVYTCVCNIYFCSARE